jgi:hypothetical protein
MNGDIRNNLLLGTPYKRRPLQNVGVGGGIILE